MTIDKKTEKLLKDLYYNPNSPGSFSGVDKLYRAAKASGAQISRHVIRQWLQRQNIYTRNRFVRRRFPTRRVVVPYIKYMYDADNAYMTDFANDNDGFKYFLLLINAFSRKVYTRALTNLTGKEVVSALRSMFNDPDFIKPEHIRSDKKDIF